MNLIKKEPSDVESHWLKFWKLAAPLISLGHLIVDVVKLFIER
jgi:hypothetical protein